MRDETAKDNRQTGSGISQDLIQKNKLAFSSTRNLQFPLDPSKKAIFLTTNQHQSPDSVCSKANLPNRPKSECKIVKIYNSTGRRYG